MSDELYNETLMQTLSPQEMINYSPATMAMYYDPDWIPAKHLTFLNDKLMEMIYGTERRLIIMMPPRHGKSMLVSIYTIVWLMTQLKNKEVMLISNTASLAGDWSLKVRETIREYSDELGANLGIKQAKHEWNTSTGCSLFALGMGGTITGRGADWLIVDDPVKNSEEAMSETIRDKQGEWFSSTAYTRLKRDGRIIIICTRWHEDDLVGRVTENNPNEWNNVVKLPAIAYQDDILGREPGEALWEEKFPIDTLEEIHKNANEKWWAALYQQQPSSGETALIRPEWWQRYKPYELPDWESCSKKIICWDTNIKGEDAKSFVVGTVWGKQPDGKIYLYDVYRGKPGITELEHICRDIAIKYSGASVVCEDAASGRALAHMMKNTYPPIGIKLITVHKSKSARMDEVAHLVKRGRVYIPEPGSTRWVNEYVKELTQFPYGVFDDQADSTSMGLKQVSTGAFMVPRLV